MFHRQRSQHQLINERENRRVRAYAQGERKQGDQNENRGFAEGAEGKSKIRDEVSHIGRLPRRANEVTAYFSGRRVVWRATICQPCGPGPFTSTHRMLRWLSCI